jgi:hypothetical protein
LSSERGHHAYISNVLRLASRYSRDNQSDGGSNQSTQIDHCQHGIYRQ